MTSTEDARPAGTGAPLLCDVCQRDHPERATLAAYVREGLRAEQSHEDIVRSIVEAGTPTAVARHLVNDVLATLLGDAAPEAGARPRTGAREPSPPARGTSVPTDPLPPTPLSHDGASAPPSAPPSPVRPAQPVVRRVPFPVVVDGVECPACGEASPTGAQFCSQCGASLAPRPPRLVRAPDPGRTSRAASWPTPHAAPHARETEEDGAGGSGLACPACTFAVASDWIACPRCGETLARTCPACGKVVEEDWSTCPWCATDIHPDAS